MLHLVELENFLSHVHTRVDFGPGVTVFVGPNGAGKSSVIDAVTFALFGEHVRKSTKGLLRRGSSQAYARVEFSVGARRFEAVRKIDSKGTSSAQLYEITDGGHVPLASGERKQFGESMTREIEALIGLDFEKLKVASIVQQGELQSIIEADPKKFKELVNAIVGIDRLDTAYEIMKKTIDLFRTGVRSRLEYDDTGIEVLKTKVGALEREISLIEPQRKAFEQEKALLEAEIASLVSAIDLEAPKELKIKEIETRREELARYIRGAITAINGQIAEKERKVSDCSRSLDLVSAKEGAESESSEAQQVLDRISAETRDARDMLAKIRGQQEIAGRLKMVDGKCPVCDSRVDRISPLFEQEHLRAEADSLTRKLEILVRDEQALQLRKRNADTRLQQAARAEAVLSSHGVRNTSDLAALRAEIESLRASIREVPLDLGSAGNITQFAIDENSTNVIRTISSLMEETRGFDMLKFRGLKSGLEQKRARMSSLDQEIGSAATKLRMKREEYEKASAVLAELADVRKYVAGLESIRSQIYNRDGPVATSLRSWALGMISQKASEYMATFNVKIQRLALEDKVRDIGITCYSGSTVLDLESLSGGEKVSVALALRLGMAHLMGSSHLNFIILDEPTTHLDHERRRSLVSVLSQAFESNVDSISQFIIITHDSEIFENSNIDAIYEFRPSPEGTRVMSV